MRPSRADRASRSNLRSPRFLVSGSARRLGGSTASQAGTTDPRQFLAPNGQKIEATYLSLLLSIFGSLLFNLLLSTIVVF
jgi:hypothetical protein